MNFFAVKFVPEIIEVKADTGGTRHKLHNLFGIVLEARISFLIVYIQELMRKTYNSLLQTLFLSKSLPALTPHSSKLANF